MRWLRQPWRWSAGSLRPLRASAAHAIGRSCLPSWSKRSRSLPAGLRSESAAVILDARHTDLPLDRSVRLAIVGAGPAGMTLARELGDLTDVLLLEAGGAEADSTVTSLQEGETAGLPYPLAQTRARQFGGSSALWAGYCAAFDPHDFERRAWVPHSGWPFGIEALQPYFARSAELLNLGDLNFDALHIARQRGERFPFDGPALTPTVWRFGTPTVRFAERFWSEFAASSAITTVLNANVVDIRLDPEHCRVTELVIRTLEGREARVRAEHRRACVRWNRDGAHPVEFRQPGPAGRSEQCRLDRPPVHGASAPAPG